MTPSLGYKLSSEQQSPADLVRQAQMAEDAGFDFALISDHYHPWTDRQGRSPFVWSVLGAIAQATRRLVVGTAVTCPTVRIHPAIVAQATATTAALMPGRFFLGVGTGENLNEHILGDGWPETEVRQERLTEAIEVIRLLWQGGNRSYHGRHFTVENARLYTLPDSPPPLLVAVGGKRGAEQAGQLGDGMIGTDPERALLAAFDKAGGSLSWELPLPAHFEAVAKLVTEDEIAESITCGPDPAKHLAAIRTYARSGYDHICVHQVGKDQKGFFEFYEQEILPQLRTPVRRRHAAAGARRRRAR
jgi:coenzyme F420-dependent glucose-6-phosphate dehydrogenase